MRLALFAATALLIFGVPASGQPSPDAAQVMKVEEQFRLAKLNHDTSALTTILAENFYQTNQNGNSRTKAQTIELWTSFPIESLTTDSSDVKITGDTAVVTGSQTERNGVGIDHMLYMRVYIRAGSTWQLLAAMQFRDPRN
jgi:hypothetical protein